MHGLDDVARTLLRDAEISRFEATHGPRVRHACPLGLARVAQRGRDARDRAEQRQLGGRVAPR